MENLIWSERCDHCGHLVKKLEGPTLEAEREQIEALTDMRCDAAWKCPNCGDKFWSLDVNGVPISLEPTRTTSWGGKRAVA